MASSFYDPILLFYRHNANNKDGQQNLVKFIKIFTFAINEQVYANKIRK